MENIKNQKLEKRVIKKKLMNKVRKKKKIHVHSRIYNNIKNVILCLITFLTVLTLGVVLSGNLLFKISKIEVTGESDYSYDEIIHASGIREGDNLFTCDLITSKKNIESTMPYVDKVEIYRDIPNKIRIKVEKVVPNFTLEHDGKYIIVSESGKMFDFTESLSSNVIELKGVELKNYNLCEQMEYVEPLAKEKIDEIIKITNENQFNVTKIDISNLYNISIKYDNRVDVVLGEPEEIEYKILTAKEILCNKIDNNEKGRLDLSSLKLDGRSYFTPEYIMK